MSADQQPPTYRCAGCSAVGCKLWRQYQTFCPKLLCATCAGADQGKDVSDLDAEGLRSGRHVGHRTDQIGWYVPAVPDEAGNYWGYTSMPDEAIARWKALPSLPVREGATEIKR